MHILLPSDVFPPGSVGGAAWSAHTLARALLARGHTVVAVAPDQGRRGAVWTDAQGVPTLRWGYAAPRLPFVQNYFRHERLWEPLAATLAAIAPAPPARLIIHAQHVQTTPAAVLAGRRLRAPVVATVRDHWPWDYFATGLHGDRMPYPRTSWASLATDLPARSGPLRGVAGLVAIPYMLAHLRRRAALLAQADAVIAVSAYIARRLAPLVSAERLHVIPNMVDLAAAETIAATPPQSDLPPSFLLFVGKLERNKGAGPLHAIYRELAALGALADLPPLLVAGSGALKGDLKRNLAALGARVHFLTWIDHDEVLRLMARCELLLFPSSWGEPLSRVLLEAAAVGAPILAMPTGGTPDIIADDIDGALAVTPEQFARRIVALLADPAARHRLGAQARQTARRRFAVEAVIPQVEQLYDAVWY